MIELGICLPIIILQVASSKVLDIQHLFKVAQCLLVVCEMLNLISSD